jgi:hypothetical protein
MVRLAWRDCRGNAQFWQEACCCADRPATPAERLAQVHSEMARLGVRHGLRLRRTNRHAARDNDRCCRRQNTNAENRARLPPRRHTPTDDLRTAPSAGGTAANATASARTCKSARTRLRGAPPRRPPPMRERVIVRVCEQRNCTETRAPERRPCHEQLPVEGTMVQPNVNVDHQITQPYQDIQPNNMSEPDQSPAAQVGASSCET